MEYDFTFTYIDFPETAGEFPYLLEILVVFLVATIWPDLSLIVASTYCDLALALEPVGGSATHLENMLAKMDHFPTLEWK